MRDFKVGDIVVCTLNKRPSYFNGSGGMDYLLNAKTKAVITGLSADIVSIKNTNPDSGMIMWTLRKRDIRIVRNSIIEGDDL